MKENIQKNNKRKLSMRVFLPGGIAFGFLTSEFRYSVIQILKEVITKIGRPVSNTELATAYLQFQETTVSPTRFTNLKDQITTAMKSFARQKIVFINSERKQFTYSLNAGIEITAEPFIPLCDELTAIVRQAVAHMGRAVRSRDVIEYAKSCGITRFSEKQIMNNMWCMAESGNLKIVEQLRGDGYGRTFFLPFDMDLPEPNKHKKLSFADLVVRTLTELWQEQIAQSEISGDLIRPLSTAVIREKLNRMPETSNFRRSRKEITSVLTQLENKAVPEVKGFAQSNGFKLWVPATVSEEDIDLKNVYSSNPLKIHTAINRAYARKGELPVSTREINKEILADQNLALTSNISLSQFLSVFTQQQKRSKNGKLGDFNFTQKIRWVGSVGGYSYFAPMEASDERCTNFIEFHNLKNQWKKLLETENISLILNCQLESARLGRARLFLRETQSFTEKLSLLKDFLEDSQKLSLYEEISSVSEQLHNLVKGQLDDTLPSEVEININGLTSAETIEFLTPFYPLAERIGRSKTLPANVFSGRSYNRFYRIPNPDFKTTTSKVPRIAARLLFERTDLLIVTALRWGGSECRLQAFIAKQELGTLRDARFITPGLNSNDFEQRTTAISCLAFLGKESEKLRTLAISDPVAEVRQAALWAYCFVKGQNYRQFARQIIVRDSNRSVLELAEQIAETQLDSDIWQI